MRELENEILIDNRSIYSRINGDKEFLKGSGSLNLSNITDISLEEILKDSETIIEGSEYFVGKIENLVIDSSLNLDENIDIVIDKLNEQDQNTVTDKEDTKETSESQETA